ncbi:hypothetical protein WN51_06374 [Melipona quadrifasciata]|uniref:Uncharacterized protein n=1 Tax=Melipona quadrifasciata TaxID=166423 RepID=A0A0N0BK17_9HYME|nr:hypothetical protein WN51_06374 [Melipona quadrifasciata]
MTRNVKGKKAAKRLPRRRVRKFWPTKIAALIVSAIQDLRETKGSTPSRIIGYISYASDVADGKVKRQVSFSLLTVNSTQRPVNITCFINELRKTRVPLRTPDSLIRLIEGEVRFEERFEVRDTEEARWTLFPSDGRRIGPRESRRSAVRQATVALFAFHQGRAGGKPEKDEQVRDESTGNETARAISSSFNFAYGRVARSSEKNSGQGKSQTTLVKNNNCLIEATSTELLLKVEKNSASRIPTIRLLSIREERLHGALNNSQNGTAAALWSQLRHFGQKCYRPDFE